MQTPWLRCQGCRARARRSPQRRPRSRLPSLLLQRRSRPWHLPRQHPLRRRPRAHHCAWGRRALLPTVRRGRPAASEVGSQRRGRRPPCSERARSRALSKRSSRRLPPAPKSAVRSRAWVVDRCASQTTNSSSTPLASCAACPPAISSARASPNSQRRNTRPSHSCLESSPRRSRRPLGEPWRRLHANRRS